MANNEIDIYGLIDSATIEGMTISPQTVREQLKAMGDVDGSSSISTVTVMCLVALRYITC